MSLGHWSDWGDVILCALRWTAYSGKIIGWSRLEEELEDLDHCVRAELTVSVFKWMQVWGHLGGFNEVVVVQFSQCKQGVVFHLTSLSSEYCFIILIHSKSHTIVTFVTKW